jgi:hypothetical protein
LAFRDVSITPRFKCVTNKEIGRSPGIRLQKYENTSWALVDCEPIDFRPETKSWSFNLIFENSSRMAKNREYLRCRRPEGPWNAQNIEPGLPWLPDRNTPIIRRRSSGGKCKRSSCDPPKPVGFRVITIIFPWNMNPTGRSIHCECHMAVAIRQNLSRVCPDVSHFRVHVQFSLS